MADTPQTLDDLSGPQREALTWLSTQQGTDPVDPPSEHRAQTWKALARHDLVALDDDGNVAMRPAGRSLFADDGAPATAEAPGETASGPAVEVSTGTGSPSAEQFAADSQSAPAAGSGLALETGGIAPDPTQTGGTVEPGTGEDPNPAQVPHETPTPIHEQRVDRLGDLRAGNRVVDPELGAVRVLGEPEKLYGTQTGKVRVPVMRVDNGSRDYLRGEPNDEVTPDA